ncbi:hypothetical protein OKJ48_26800 [Streptomyces kunmingensis]|uniref:DUF4178 domain-containing protein n=1 Tax=Streptomyces kunmingensis TaxID=68225 RepID=A0ABU6CGH3_9ACTN|nr:hypothetical protein [Streptomyces kunmingensis]MEB3963820.1 hypothetical protein [Streptomyces kunmingensis]
MGLFDKLTGTRRPDDGVEPRPPQEVREALLALAGPDAPWTVRAAAPEERADLVAEWRVREPAWQEFFRSRHVDRTVRVRLRLVPDEYEVRALDEQWEVTWRDGTPRFARSREYSRGPSRTVSRRWSHERGADGERHMEETFSFDSAEMKDPLRDTVLASGWAWRAVVFGKL